MRPQYLPLLTLLAASVSTPAVAQQAQPVFGGVVGGVVVAPAPLTKATPDAVVARLMSFDRDGDGRIVVGELPERMQNLLTRGDSSRDGALDRAEIRQLAVAPTQLPIRNGFQAGLYGFNDNGFDTSQRLESALDDLRLAAGTKERAIDVARKFQDASDAKAPEVMLSTMSRLLSPEQLEDFRGALEGRMVTVTAIRRDGVMIFGATLEEAAGQEHIKVRLREGPSKDPAREIERYGLDGDRRRQALEAIRVFKTHTPGRLNDTEQVALLEQFRGLLTDEQRDDLRAALGRRSVVKLASGSASISLELMRQQLEPRVKSNAQPN